MKRKDLGVKAGLVVVVSCIFLFSKGMAEDEKRSLIAVKKRNDGMIGDHDYGILF